MSYKKRFIIVVFVVASIILVSCINTDIDQKTDTQNEDNNDLIEEEAKGEETKEKEERDIIIELHQLSQTSEELSKIIKFVDENICKVSKEKASLMINILEISHYNYLQTFEKKFYNLYIEEDLLDIFNSSMDLEELENIEDEDLKELFIETKNKGYKIETAEGTFFPTIDYKFYKKYNDYVTEDIKKYIEIMTIESTEVFAKDAALIISWDELIDRAVKQENFITKYPNSIKIDRIKKLFLNYSNYIFYGLDNTPLFTYKDNIIEEEAKEAYLQSIKNKPNSKLIKTIEDFINVLEKNDYKLTDDVNSFREEALKNLLNS